MSDSFVAMGHTFEGNTATEIQLVVFDLAKEAYGIGISTAREIIRMQEITQVPGTPDFVEGVINLRGKVIPVLDLRKKLGLTVGDQSEDTRIVVVAVAGQDIGVIVNAVTEVLRISNDSVEPLPAIATSADAEYLRGIAKVDSRLIILLDLDKVLSRGEKGTLSDVSSPRTERKKSALSDTVSSEDEKERRSPPDTVLALAEKKKKKALSDAESAQSAMALAGSKSR